jgi:sugar lactone lactonase YvrE
MTLYTRGLAAILFTLALAAQPRPQGDSRLFAPTPSPGFPEGIAVRGDKVYVSGPASFGIFEPARVWEFDRVTGALLRDLPITFANPFMNGMRAASCLTFGPDGALYVIEAFTGVIRMSLDPANSQSLYATFPPPASPIGALLNDLDFDAAGNLYVTDSFGGIIYKVAPGGGPAAPWFQDPRLLGHPAFPFGVNGLRVDQQKNRLVFAVTVRQDFSGAIYTLPLKPAPTAADLAEFHVFQPTAEVPLPGPDGLELAKNGRVYVALAGPSRIAVLNPDGTPYRTYSGPAGAFPWANPANIAFDDAANRILFTNHASLVPYDPNLFAVIDVAVNDKGN